MNAARTLPLLLALSGCFFVDDARFAREVEDADGDGGISERFDGPDCKDDDPTIADCDADGDGYRAVVAGGDDCDDHDASAVPGTAWFHDTDGDGYGDADDATTGCGSPPAGWSTSDRDCDDADAAINPNAQETCDALDRNCDGDAIAASDDATVKVWPDADDDSYGEADATPFFVCDGASGVATRQGDCDDTNRDVSPDAVEVPYDGVDQDCDASNEFDADLDGEDALAHGGADCDDTSADVNPNGTEACDGLDNDCDGLIDAEDPSQPVDALVAFYADLDGDGFGGTSPTLACAGSPPAGYVLDDTDCDDDSDAVHPGAVEWCNRRDDDCNDVADDGSAIDAFTAYVDDDLDGFGSQGLTVCELAASLALRGGDCIDDDPATYPGAPEVCGDPVRQDCSAADVDDCDGDGYLANATTNPDCDDDPQTGPAAHPGQPEACDGFDNDCDGLLDAADPDVLPSDYPDWYLDLDGDGHGEPVILATNTCAPPAFGAPNDDDCDDLDSFAYPGAPESCDQDDNDCDGFIDEGATDTTTQYEDRDGDGFGSASAELMCAGDPAYSGFTGDCDDDDPSVAPNAVEACDDRVDNDCDGLTDAADPDAATDGLWFPDDDRDGVGRSPGLFTCGDPSTSTSPYVAQSGDCDDADAGQQGPALWFADLDNDGYAGTQTILNGCKPVGSWEASAQDCNDTVPGVHPNQSDGCNLRDDDCDGTFDDDPLPNDPAASPYHADVDGDGWGSAAIAGVTCFDPPAGAVNGAGDCDDDDAATSPNATEVCNDGLDNDCNAGTTDECPCVGWQWIDADNDGFGSPFSDPYFDCVASGALAPDDCDDLTPGRQGSFVEIGPTQAASLVTLVQAPGCGVIRLAEGTYPTATLTPAAGSSIRILSKNPNNPSVLSSAAGGRVIDLANTGSDLMINDVVVSGANVTDGLVHDVFDRLVLTNTTLDGLGSSRGIVADGGTLRLFGVTVKDVTSAAPGSALYLSAAATAKVSELDVQDASGATSVYLDPAGGRVFDDVQIRRSGTVAVSGAGTAEVRFNRLEIWDSVGTALYSDADGTLSVSHAVIARSGGRGVDYLDGGLLQLHYVTIIGTAGTGVFAANSTATVYDSFVFNSGGGDVYAPFGVAGRSHIGSPLGGITPTDNIGPPAFTRYEASLPGAHPSLPGEELWDFHLRYTSPGRGEGDQGEDVGAYAKDDGYYRDATNDGIPDGWARLWLGTSLISVTDDPDGDGLNNLGEYLAGTCQVVPDTDQDGTNDQDDSTGPLNPNVHP